MAKVVIHDEEARKRVLAGAKILYKAVKTTMGPKGRNVAIGNNYGPATVTHDGVTVAKSIDLPNTEETRGYKVGAELIKQAAIKMNDVAGDGTTTITVLTYHILNEANKLIAAGHNPMLLKQGLDRAAKTVLKELAALSTDINSDADQVAQIGTISAGDPAIGKLIAEVMQKVGKDGVVTVEQGQAFGLESEVVEGFTFNRGYISPYMVTDQARLEAVYDKPAIVITDRRVSSIQEFLPLLEKLAQSGRTNMVLICEDVEGETLGTLILNKLKGTFNAVAIKAPSFGDERREILQDIAALTGATVISDELGITFENATIEMVGSARKVIVAKDETTIIEGVGTGVADRIKEIDGYLENLKEEHLRTGLEKRSAALQNKVAVIKVGGATETEIEEKKFRVDDAVAAVKAALAEGVVPGGGVTLLNLSDKLKIGTGSIGAGEQLLKNALQMPFKILMRNSGLNPDEWLPQIRAAEPGYGVNVNTADKLVNLRTEGVIDPSRVTKEALLNATSIAGTAMTMGALIVELPEENKPMQPQQMMGMPGQM